MTSVSRASVVLFMLGEMTFAPRVHAQAGQPRPPSEADVINYVEDHIYGTFTRGVYLSRAEVEQLRVRIFQSPEVSIPILRKIVLDGRVGAGRAAVVGTQAEATLRDVARVLTKDTDSAKLIPNIERLSSLPTPRPGECVVLDVMGNLTVAWNLAAHYSALGQWLSGPPTSVQPTLRFVFRSREGHVASEDSLAIPLGRVVRLALGTYEGGGVWSILLRDGTHLGVFPHRLEETPARGQAVVRREYEDYSLKAGEVQGEPLTFRGFRGVARSASGRQGRMEIEEDQVALVQCGNRR